MSPEPVLECRGLKKYFERGGFLDNLPWREKEELTAVDDVSLTLERNQSIGLIGESGCGKTTLMMTLLGRYQPTGGEVFFKGQPVSTFDRHDWKRFRRRVQTIFQDPFNSLNPRMSVSSALKEPLKIHDVGDEENRVRDVLEAVELQPAEKYLSRRPNELSGGELQRVSIARALVLEPEVILADEPVSMLDVSTQASILRLLARLRDEIGLSIIYVSHDLSTVPYVCETIDVMYLGRVVEEAPTLELIRDPKHPYTQALVSAIPVPDPHANRERTTMDGAPAAPVGLGEGCRFRDRCPERMEVCEVTPDVASVESESGSGERHVACHLYYDHPTEERMVVNNGNR